MKQANTEQRNFMRDISYACEQGVIGGLYGEDYENCNNWQIHHVKGRSYKHNKIAIGHWFVIPVPFELHDVNSNHDLNVTHHKKAFTKEFGLQSEIFEQLVGYMSAMGFQNLPSDQILEAIMDTRE